MSAPANGDPSERLLSEVARHIVIPTGIVDSVWFDLEERFDEWAVDFDAWQDGLGQLLLSTRADGKYATTVGGSTISIARQVAKTFIVSRTVFALASKYEGLTALWTAHRTRTATQTFQKLAGFAQRKSVKPYMAVNRNDGIRATNGEQEIEFRNGSRIMFGAREQGFGRGFDEVDVEVFDESQILTEKALEDMIPAANQSRNEHGGLILFMGTPPRPVDPGEVMKLRRRKALDGKPDGQVIYEHGNALYVETSADPDVGQPGGPALDDIEQIRKANPSYPHRTPQESIDRMRENLPSDDAWRREALGVWDSDESGSRAITASQWEATGVDVAPDGLQSFGVAFSQDGSRVSLAGARKHDDGVHVELVDALVGDVDQGLGALADWLAERWRKSDQIALSGRSGALVLAHLLRERKVPSYRIHLLTTPQYFQACQFLLDGVREGTVTHLNHEGQQVLDESVAVADKKTRGGAWGWSVTVPDGDETPIEAVSVALWAARTSKRASRVDSKMKVVVM
ncbi:hypothetical protein QP735_04305 [Curtobacterium citreum]|uniref:hypothetical protein n=1 Tax=Curtobacterium citreum TaxID=2036 RepID=UPI00254A03FF|nr:hypothetical protein [Curtobacterium citreum]MDK8171746.1 hypothetical protein [Curtobacterium citreum]